MPSSDPSPNAETYLQLLNENEKSLAAYVHTIVVDAGDAEDIFQACRLTLWKQFKPLAEFTITKRASSGIIDIESKALSEFVRQSPEDWVTLLIVRNTGEFDKQGLVHDFASKVHH